MGVDAEEATGTEGRRGLCDVWGCEECLFSSPLGSGVTEQKRGGREGTSETGTRWGIEKGPVMEIVAYK